MKKMTLIIVSVLGAIIAQAQSSSVQPLLANYLGVKEALVKSDATIASEKAGLLLAAINQTDGSSLSKKEKEIFEKEKEVLVKTSEGISKTNSLEKQRAYFSDLSVSLWKLIKIAESVSGNVFYQYCPMKKSYWLSAESAIKNPYYGSAMLTCGNVSDKKVQ